nr:short integuments 2, mitochondrial [Quercus suber]
MRAIQTTVIAHQPSINVLDIPGVLVPSIPDIETELKLALAGSVKCKHLNNRRLEGIQYDYKEKHEYNLKDLRPKRRKPSSD